jgi:hypothetical protein
MKVMGYNVELATEYAKDMVWEGRDNVLSDQLYILAKQNRKLVRLKDQVDWVIMDSPILLGLSYVPVDYYKNFEALVLEMWHGYDNLSVLIERSFEYQPIGRLGDVANAHRIDQDLKIFLDKNSIEYQTIGVDQFNEDVVDSILCLLGLKLNSST